MNRRRFFFLSVALLTTSFTVAAQWDERDAFFGTGELRISNRNAPSAVITLARAGIRRDGQAVEVRLRTLNESIFALSGRITRETRPETTVQITSVNGETANGVIRIRQNGDVSTVGPIYQGSSVLSVRFDAEERATGGPSPDKNVPALTLSDNGYGTISIRGRRAQSFERATVTTRRDGTAEIAFRASGGLDLNLRGVVTRYTTSAMTIDLRSSGAADVSGRVQVNHNRRTLQSFSGSGELDGQRFQVSFDGAPSRPTPSPALTLTQRGSGVYDQEGRRRERITSAAVTVRANGSADVELRLDNGNTRAFSGRVLNSDESSIRVRITGSGNADASGSATIRRYGRNGIASINLDGTLDGQSVFAYFSR